MGFLTKSDILNADDLTRIEIEVSEWGGSVWVGTMSGKERDQLEAYIIKGRSGNTTDINTANLRARMVVLTVCDEEGNRLFENKDIELLGEKSAAALEKVFNAGMHLNGFTEGDVEELVKN